MEEVEVRAQGTADVEQPASAYSRLPLGVARDGASSPSAATNAAATNMTFTTRTATLSFIIWIDPFLV